MLGAGSFEVGTAEIDKPHLVSRGARLASATSKDRALALVSLGVTEIGAAAGVAVGAKPEWLGSGLLAGVGRP